jgi:hypothetical protein
MTDPRLAYVAGDGPPRSRTLPGLAAHTIAFNIFVCVLLAGFAWWLRLRDDQLIYQAMELARLRAEIADLRGSCSALPARGGQAR